MPVIKPLSLLCTVLGFVMVLAGLLADALSIGHGRGFGHVQFLLTVAGVTLVYLTARGSTSTGIRFGQLSTVFLNTILLLAFFELISTVCLRLMSPAGARVETQVSRPDDRLYPAWVYKPIVTFTSVPNVSTGLVTTDPMGFRVTPGNESEADTDGFVVFCFGGSTMWGWGESDEHTIPAFLQGILSSVMKCPVMVVNRSSPGWVSNQELMQLLLCLWDGERPDLVIFYDGGNDFGLTRMGLSGTHLRREFVESALNFSPCREVQSGNLLLESLNGLNTSRLLSSILGRAEKPGFSYYPTIAPNACSWSCSDSLGSETLSGAFRNYRVALALGEFYGFRCLFAWHPVLAASSKPLAAEEVMILNHIAADSLVHDEIRTTWEMAEELAAEGGMQGFVFLGGALDSCAEQCFVDEVHMNRLGNRIMAESLYSAARRLDLIQASHFEERCRD